MPRPTDKPVEKTPEKVAEKPIDKPVEKKAVVEPELSFVQHMVIINGVDHVILASNEADLQKKIAVLRGA